MNDPWTWTTERGWAEWKGQNGNNLDNCKRINNKKRKSSKENIF